MDSQSAANQPQHDSDSEEQVQSVSVTPSTAPRHAEAILPKALYLEIKPNNHFIDFDSFRHPDPMVVAILKGHELCTALTATATVPNVYVQQLWHTIYYDPNDKLLYFNLDNHELTLSCNTFRKLLGLPRKRDMPHRMFVDFGNEEDICRDLQFMGYMENIRRLMDFKRKHIPGIWNSFFGILLRCLSPQTTGLDKTNRNYIQIFHAFCFCWHVDYSIPLWAELVEWVKAKKKTKAKPYIPFLRFIQLVVAGAMQAHPDITKRKADKEPYVPPKLKYQLSKPDPPDANPMVIAMPLLLKADQTNEAVVAYKVEHYRFAAPRPQEPRSPTPAASPERREEREESRENIERGAEEGRGDEPADSERTISNHPDEGAGGVEGGDTRIDEGVQVEKSPRQAEGVSRQKRIAKGRSPAKKSRENQRPVDTTSCGVDTAQVTASPTVQTTLPSHSLGSQQPSVSFSHRDLPHTLGFTAYTISGSLGTGRY